VRRPHRGHRSPFVKLLVCPAGAQGRWLCGQRPIWAGSVGAQPGANKPPQAGLVAAASGGAGTASIDASCIGGAAIAATAWAVASQIPTPAIATPAVIFGTHELGHHDHPGLRLALSLARNLHRVVQRIAQMNNNNNAGVNPSYSVACVCRGGRGVWLGLEPLGCIARHGRVRTPRFVALARSSVSALQWASLGRHFLEADGGAARVSAPTSSSAPMANSANGSAYPHGETRISGKIDVLNSPTSPA
jgi:hypothetical protein